MDDYNWGHVTQCDAYFVNAGDGCFIPLRHIDPGEEEELYTKYCPSKAQKKGGKRGKVGKGKKGGKSTGKDDGKGDKSSDKLGYKSGDKSGDKSRDKSTDKSKASGDGTHKPLPLLQEKPNDMPKEEVIPRRSTHASRG